MTRLLIHMLLQTAMMALSQVTLKLGLQRLDGWSWSWQNLYNQVLLNGWLLLAVLLIIGANLYWFYLLKTYPLSVAYPLTSLGFVFGMLAGMLLLHETVVWQQWIGVMLVLAGCFFIAR